jgi:hypothetical protein
MSHLGSLEYALASAGTITAGYFTVTTLVPDLVSRIRDVVLVRRIFSSGKPQGVGNLEWGGNGEGMERGRSVYEQPGSKVDGILSRKGGFPSK